MLKGLEVAYQVVAELETAVGYPLLVNDSRLVRFVDTEARTFLGDDCVHPGPPRMGSEDFAFFLQKFPGILLRVGCHDPARGIAHGLHSPFFDLDERVLDVGVRLFTHLLSNYTESGQDQ